MVANDLIGRKAALEIIMKYCPDDDGSCSKADIDPREMLDEIESLPAVDAVPVAVGGALGMFIMAAMVVSSDRRDDNEQTRRPDGKTGDGPHRKIGRGNIQAADEGA